MRRPPRLEPLEAWVKLHCGEPRPTAGGLKQRPAFSLWHSGRRHPVGSIQAQTGMLSVPPAHEVPSSSVRRLPNVSCRCQWCHRRHRWWAGRFPRTRPPRRHGTASAGVSRCANADNTGWPCSRPCCCTACSWWWSGSRCDRGGWHRRSHRRTRCCRSVSSPALPHPPCQRPRPCRHHRVHVRREPRMRRRERTR